MFMFLQDFKVLSDARFSELCAVVGVSKQCSFAPDQKLIEKAFRKKALKCHPDKGGDPVIFKKLNDAYYKLIGHVTKVKVDSIDLKWYNPTYPFLISNKDCCFSTIFTKQFFFLYMFSKYL